MTEFTICSKSEVKKTVKQFSATHLISLLDPNDYVYRPPCIPGTNHLQLNFYDEEESFKSHGPRIWHAEAILSFGSRLPLEARVVVHCHAGICRSTAAGLALWLQHNGLDRLDDAEAWLDSVRGNAIPNSLLGSHFDLILGLNGQLNNLISKISIKNTEKLLLRFNN